MDRIIIKSLSQSGFSLLETLVAVSILGLLLTGSAALVQQALKVSSKLKNDTTALYLAQEGLVLVRYQRDTNRLSDPDPDEWMDGIAGGSNCGSGNGCTADVNPLTGVLTLNNNCGGGCPVLKFHAPTKTYNYHPAGVDTDYRRTIWVNNIPGPEPEVRVRVMVQWATVFGSRSYTVEENLLNWQ